MHVIGFVLFLFIILLPLDSDAEHGNESIKTPTLKKTLESLKLEMYSETIKILSEYRSEVKNEAAYHFIYGRALKETKRFHDSLEHFRLAYLYASNNELKELSLLERAEVYFKMKRFREARALYILFLKNYPDSEYLKKTHLGLAKSLAGIGLLRDSLKYYDKAEKGPESVFGKASILQRLGMVKEANGLYATGIEQYRNYLQGSDESRYYLGENLRSMGKLSEAKEYLLSLKGSPYEYEAELSLGMIATGESETENAIKHFHAALLSTNRDIRRHALLNLARAHIINGNVNEAKLSLEEIRYKHFYGDEYDEAILKLSEIYRMEGKFDAAASLLKELVMRPSPLREALDGLEAILQDVKERDMPQFIHLWKSVGPWLLESSREPFLLNIAGALKDTGKPFLEVTLWLLKHGSTETKMRSLKALADFYAVIGDTKIARVYIERLRKAYGTTDEILRMEAEIFYEDRDFRSLAEKIMAIKRIKQEDLRLFMDTFTSAKDVEKAIIFYEKTLKKLRGEAEIYNKLADVLYELHRNNDSLHYYKLALQSDPINEWALYRIGSLDGTGGKEILKKISNGDSAISNLAGEIVRELDIVRRISEVSL